jgi:hypothetical protein
MLPVVLFVLTSSTADLPTRPPTVVVRLYRRFGNARESSLVEANVEDIFARAGVGVRWVYCTPPPSSGPADSPCARPARPGEFVLRLLKRTAPRRDSCSHGFALVPADGRAGGYATVFTDGLAELRGTIAPWSQLLAHFTAHEIGHLLLGRGHAASGLMRANWSRSDLDRAARGRLTFTPAEAERMRARLTAFADSAPAETTTASP